MFKHNLHTIMYDNKYKKEAEQYKTLGAEYFDARDVVRKFMEQFEEKRFKPLVKDICDKIEEKLWEDLTCHLITDTESNLHTEITRIVEDVIRALLTGDKPTLNKYVFDGYSRGGKIRKELIKLIPKELQDARIKDLEIENKALKEQLNWR